MPRPARAAPGGFVYHVLNRAVARLPLFEKEDDYAAFERVMVEALDKHPIRLIGYCLMPNHWHLLLWPRRGGELSAHVRWLTHTHTMRWHAHHHTSGTGHLYQGRFKSFPVAEDDHYYAVLRYVERNALRANLVPQAESWRWGSLWRRGSSGAETPALADGPLTLPANWAAYVNKPQTEAELEAIRRSVCRGTPYGTEDWQKSMAGKMRLQHTLRPRGRPRQGQ